MTPGGFLQGTMLVRTRNKNADTPNDYSAVPVNGWSDAKLSQFQGGAHRNHI